MKCRILFFTLGLLSVGGCAYFPIGTGSRVHVCGNVVDENLKPVMDTLTLNVRIDRPLMNPQGKVVRHSYVTKITDSKFCIDGKFSMSLTAHLSGKYIAAHYFSVMYRGLKRDDFKWIVERNENITTRPEFESHHITIDTAERSRGVSVLFKETNRISRNGEMLFRPRWIASLLKMSGVKADSNSFDSLFNLWDSKYPNSIIMKEWYPIGNTWTISKPKFLFDYHMFQRADSLFFVPGPLAKTKFIPASLDTPICNFGRLPAPPPIADPAWRDTLLVAIGPTPVLDAYYVHFPWIGKWAKVILDQQIEITKTKIGVNVTHVFADVGDTKLFVFWNSPNNSYVERKKCLTKVESMWAGEYGTVFMGE